MNISIYDDCLVVIDINDGSMSVIILRIVIFIIYAHAMFSHYVITFVIVILYVIKISLFVLLMINDVVNSSILYD